MPFFYPTTTDIKLKDKNLIVPIVSNANVSQLSADLFIASLSLRRAGIFDPRHLIPVVGARDDGEDGLTTPLELYGKEGLDVLVVQQRSPVLQCLKKNFVDSLLNFIREAGLASVIFLSSVNPINRTDTQMLTPTYHIRPSNAPPLTSTPLARLTDLPIPAYTSPVLQKEQQSSERDKTIVPFIPGGGLTRSVLSSLPNGWPVPTVSLLQFAMEGDNRADATILAAAAAKLLNLDILEWKQPATWTYGLFGAPPSNQGIYS